MPSKAPELASTVVTTNPFQNCLSINKGYPIQLLLNQGCCKRTSPLYSTSAFKNKFPNPWCYNVQDKRKTSADTTTNQQSLHLYHQTPNYSTSLAYSYLHHLHHEYDSWQTATINMLLIAQWMKFARVKHPSKEFSFMKPGGYSIIKAKYPANNKSIFNVLVLFMNHFSYLPKMAAISWRLAE